MNAHSTELLSALADGELKGFRRWMVERHVRGCAACAAEVQQLNRMRQMLLANPPSMQMSDSTEFFWSKVKRGIEQRRDERAVEPIPSLSPADWLGQRRFALATVAAVIVAMIGVVWMMPPHQAGQGNGASQPGSNFAKVHQVNTPIPDTVATAFDSQEASATVIWISGLPWTEDMDEMQDEFENLEI